MRISILKAFVNELDLRVEKLSGENISCATVAMKQKISAAYLQLGREMIDAGYFEEGFATSCKAVQVQPENSDANYFVLSKLEQLNRIDEAWTVLRAFENKCSSLYDTCKKLYIIKARLEYRRGNLEISSGMLEKFLMENPLHSHRAKAYGWLGKTLDRLGKHDSAMRAFEKYNEAISDDPVAAEMIQKSHNALADVEASLRWYSGKTSFGWQETIMSDNLASPILLVGFPRSGTTLLDQILNSHSALTTIEEKATLADIRVRFFGCEEKLMSLKRLSSHELLACRQTYWSNIAKFQKKNIEKSTVVDKFPLNIRFLDIFARLFPEVKIIVALRDPRDVILSNYMQMYQLNPEMAMNLNLLSSARYYSRVMELYLLFRKFIPGNIHEVRYEDIVCNFKGESSKLLAFLGLEWEENLERYYENAKNRWIGTPSYDQVTKPIYHDAVGRWKNYENCLEEIKPMLQPFVAGFGYST